MEAILNRRSIRNYTSDPVSEDDLKDILTAAMSAPSAGNQQPWYFIVINDRNILDRKPSDSRSGKRFGAVWLGVYPTEDRVKGLRDLLQLPEHVIPLSIVPIGHPAESKPPVNRYDENRIRYNKWS